MGEEPLSGLATLYIHSKIDMDLEKVIDIFASKNLRSLLWMYIIIN
jgi:hypothetical protein